MEKFEFKSAICTSLEQSKRLLELGLKKETADCGHFYGRREYEECEDWETVILDDNWKSYWDVTDKEIPAWSLHRLMEMYGDNYNYFWLQNAYNELIHAISISIEDGSFNKDYLEEKNC